MPHTRRQFLHTSLSLGALLALPAAATTVAAAADSPAPAGPRRRGLLFDAADLPRLRATVQRPEFQRYWTYLNTVDFAADEKFLRTELRVTNHSTHSLQAQVILQRSAFLHALHPDARHLALARTALAALLGFPRWDWIQDSHHEPVTVMRGAGACIAVALASDWLAADLTAAEQEAIDTGLATAGAPACYRGLDDMTHHDTAAPWSLNPGEEGLPPVDVARWPTILNRTNLRIVTTAGLAAAVGHLHGRHPDAPKWLALTRDSLQRFASWQPADGTFGEGIAYWEFTYTHFVFALEVLRRRLDIDERGLLDFPAEARYARSMTMPTAGRPDDCVNLGDASGAALGVPLAWIAREFRDTNAQALTQQAHAFGPNWLSTFGAIWFDPTVPVRLAGDAPLDVRQAIGIVVSRTGWAEADNVLAFRSGGPENHEHADRNSVIFKAHRERLLHDPLHAAYATTDPHWLLRQTEAHTAVLIDGKGHLYHDGRDGTNASEARAVLQDHRIGLDWMSATSDATDAYRRAGLPVRVVQRTVVFLKPDVLVLLDRVALDEARPVQARFQVFNEDGAGRVTADGLGFAIDRPYASLRAVIAAAGPGRASAGKLALPEAGGVYPYAEYRSDAALVHTFVTACTVAPQGAEHGRISVTHENGTWRIAGTHRGQTVRLALAEADGVAVPALTL